MGTSSPNDVVNRPSRSRSWNCVGSTWIIAAGIFSAICVLNPPNALKSAHDDGLIEPFIIGFVSIFIFAGGIAFVVYILAGRKSRAISNITFCLVGLLGLPVPYDKWLGCDATGPGTNDARKAAENAQKEAANAAARERFRQQNSVGH